MTHHLAAILRTDIVGSTETWNALGPDYIAFRNEHKRRVRAILDDYDKAPQLTGDGFVAIIPTATAAIECAARIQMDLASQNDAVQGDELLSIRVRIMIDAAELVTDGAGEPASIAFAVLARLEEHTHAGEIVCTDVVRSLAREHVLPHRFHEQRTVHGKGFDEPISIWMVRWEESLPDPGNLSIPTPRVDTERTFLGRRHELQELFSWLESSARDNRHLVMVEGPPGIGKSTLVKNFASQVVDDSSALVLFGTCETPVKSPYGPFAEALRTFARHASAYPELLGAHSQWLGPLLPQDLATELKLEPVEHRGSEDERLFQLFEAFSSWLSVNARHRPIVLIIEDLHRADQATLGLLDHLVRSTAPGRFLFITTQRQTRSDWTNAFANSVDALTRQSVAAVMVPGLGQRHIIDMMSLFPQQLRQVVDADVAESLWRYTGGNPLYLSSLLAAPGEFAKLVGSGSDTPLDLDVSTEVRHLTSSRLASLSSTARGVVTLAAVIGNRFDTSVIGTISELDDARLAQALDEAQDAGFVEPTPSEDASIYGFVHEILRDAILTEATERNEQELHARHVTIGRVLLRGEPGLNELTAASIHLAYGQDVDSVLQAVDVARQVARLARAHLSPQLVAEAIGRELSLYERLGDSARPAPAEIARRTYAYGQALRHAGDPRYVDVLRNVCVQAHGFDDPVMMAKAALGSLRSTWDTGRVPIDTIKTLTWTLETVTEHAARLTPEQGRSELLAWQAQLSGALAAELSFDPDRAKRERHSIDAVTTARQVVQEQTQRSGERLAIDTLARTLERQHFVFAHPARLVEREQIIAELVALQPKLQDANRRFTTASLSYWTSMELGQVEQAKHSLRAVRELADSQSEPSLRAIALHWESLQATHVGRVDQATKLADEATGIRLSIGDGDAEVLRVGLMFLPHLYRGTLPQLLDNMTRCVERAAGLVGIRSGIALALLQQGGPYAEHECREALARLSLEDEFGQIAHNDLLIAYAVSMRACAPIAYQEMAELIRDRLESYQFIADGRPRFIFNGTSMFGSVSHYLAMAHSTLEDWVNADETFRLALAHNEQLGAPGLVADTQCAWAEMLYQRRRSEDLETSRRLARSSFATATELGLSEIQRRADRLL